MNDFIRLEPRKLQRRTAEGEGDARGVSEHIAQALRELQYGTVTIVVQDGVIVQVERTERTRFK
jgi:hypothetical protein